MSYDMREHMRRTVEEVWNHGDVEGFTEAFTDDAVLAPQSTYPEGGATIKGREKITAFFKTIHSPVDLGSIDQVGENQVMCSFRNQGGDPDAPYEWTFLYTFDGDRIVRARYYTDPAQAKQAAADPSS